MAKQMEFIKRNRFADSDVLDFGQMNRSPISGYEDLPIRPLEKTVEGLVKILPVVLDYVATAKKNCKKDSSLLTLDESAAIYLYTMSTPFFSRLNIALRAENRHELKPWFAFLKLFMTALEKLPPLKKVVVWRAISTVVSSNLNANNTQIWWSVNSCSTDMEVLDAFLGEEGTVFAIEVINGKQIDEYSAMKMEKEVILMPGTRVRAKSNPLNFKNHYLIVHLEEEESKPERERDR
jgi:hypothetical protein